MTITYFHTGIRTIIGVESFHGPVRDGKGWDQLAMVIRHDLLPHREGDLACAANLGRRMLGLRVSRWQHECLFTSCDSRHDTVFGGAAAEACRRGTNTRVIGSSLTGN